MSDNPTPAVSVPAGLPPVELPSAIDGGYLTAGAQPPSETRISEPLRFPGGHVTG